MITVIINSSSAASVAGYDSDGEPTGLREAYPDAAGTITTRVGAVIGCSNGAPLTDPAADSIHAVDLVTGEVVATGQLGVTPNEIAVATS